MRVDTVYGVSLWALNSISYEWAGRKSEISSWTQEEKFHIYKQPYLWQHFWEFSEDFRGLSKDFRKLWRRPNKHFQAFSKLLQTFPNIFWRIPRITKDCWRRQKKIQSCFDHTPTNLSVVKVIMTWKIISAYLKAFQNTEEWHFSFWNIFFHFRDIDVFLLCKLISDDVILFATKNGKFLNEQYL